MRFKNLLHFVVVLLIGQMLFACSSAEYYRFSATKPEAYNSVKEKPDPAAEPATTAPALTLVAVAQTTANEAPAPATPALEASITTPAPAAMQKKSAEVVNAPVEKTSLTLAKREITVVEAEALAMVNERLSDMSKAEKKELKREMKETFRQNGGGANIVEIILAVLLPPLAVFLHDGLGTSFWISIILTLLFWVPGIIYALLVVTDTI